MQIKLGQVILFSADVSRLVKFYQEFFGLSVIGEINPEWTVMNAGLVEIAFHRIGEQYLETMTEDFKADSNVKFVFEVDTDLIAFRKSLLDKNVDLGEIKQFPGADYIVCDGQDPEGNVFQLKQTLL